MPWRTVVPLAVVGLALGSLFGSAEVTTVAFAEEHGARGTGVLLALWALGSLLAGRDRRDPLDAAAVDPAPGGQHGAGPGDGAAGVRRVWS